MRAALRDAIYAGQVEFCTPAPVGMPGGQNPGRQWRWRSRKVDQLAGQLAREILRRAEDADAREDYAGGSRLVGRLADGLLDGKVHKAFDEAAIRDHAENYSRLCGRMLTLEARALFADSCKVAAPTVGRLVTVEGAAARLADPTWWRRQLRRSWTRRAEGGLRDIGLVRKGREPYASDLAVRHRAAQKQRWREFMERSLLVNLDTADQLPLLDVAESSLANPRLRRGEFMCRVRGFEEIAGDLGHVAEFVTLTCPSAFHAQLAAGGANPAYSGASVRDGQRWLCRMWARARAAIARRPSMLVYGFRIAEPHHDGTPHWHALLFTRPADAEALRKILAEVWCKEFPEPGAAEHRVKFERIDPTKGSAVGYVAKYVSKNIDGAGAIGAAEDSEIGAPVSSGVARVDTWASVHGIRQFQQIGGPPVGLWRECRRLRAGVEDADIERARLCADRGDWRGFVQRVGGIHAGRSTNLRLETAESGERNRYGEARPARIVGLRWASAVEITRPHRWRMEHRAACVGPSREGTRSGRDPQRTGRGAELVTPRSDSPVFSALGPVAITVRGASSAGSPNTWSNPHETSRAGPE